jgi:hypothetical protein
MKKSLSQAKKGKKSYKKPRAWGLASRSEHRRIKGKQKRK